jgi:hypothetical protein
MLAVFTLLVLGITWIPAARADTIEDAAISTLLFGASACGPFTGCSELLGITLSVDVSNIGIEGAPVVTSFGPLPAFSFSGGVHDEQASYWDLGNSEGDILIYAIDEPYGNSYIFDISLLQANLSGPDAVADGFNVGSQETLYSTYFASPEPGGFCLTLLGTGLLGLVVVRRRFAWVK